MPTLVDSSLWVHQLRRRGDPVHRAVVESLLRQGEAAWCPVIRLELWRGVKHDGERRALQHYEAVLPDYPITDAVWAAAISMAGRGRSSGLTVPMADLVVFACAREHGLSLAHDDRHFDALDALARQSATARK
jgi:predicted nucleic acid-binding protein